MYLWSISPILHTSEVIQGQGQVYKVVDINDTWKCSLDMEVIKYTQEVFLFTLQ